MNVKEVASSPEPLSFVLERASSLNGLKLILLILVAAHCLPQAEASCIWDCDKHPAHDFLTKLGRLTSSDINRPMIMELEHDLLQARMNGAGIELTNAEFALYKLKREEERLSDLKRQEAFPKFQLDDFIFKRETDTRQIFDENEQRQQPPAGGQCVNIKGVFFCRPLEPKVGECVREKDRFLCKA